MKERPIVMSAPMVRALLAGTKTQTRRVMPHQPPEILPGYAPKVYWPARDRHMTSDPESAAYLQFERPGDYDGMHVMRGGFGFRCLYGQPGDRLWVREEWYCDDYRVQSAPYLKPDDMNVAEAQGDGTVLYRASSGDRPYEAEQPVWRPSIHMPRWASRITLEIKAVRVERLQDISEADARAEGIAVPNCQCGYGLDGNLMSGTASGAYMLLWKSIHGPGSWAANPWVWVAEFRRAA